MGHRNSTKSIKMTSGGVKMKWLNHKAFIISLLIAWPFFFEGPQICSFLPSIGEGQALAPAEEWWDEAYQYRAAIKVTNNSAAEPVPIGYSVWLTFDHATLVSDSKSLFDTGNDVRVVYWTGSGWTELDRAVDPCTLNQDSYYQGDPRFDWNKDTTRIWFKTQAVIAASGFDDNYYLYYGNDSPAAVMDDYSNLYDLWDPWDYADWPEASANWTQFTEEYYHPVDDTIYKTSNFCEDCASVPAPSDINWTTYNRVISWAYLDSCRGRKQRNRHPGRGVVDTPPIRGLWQRERRPQRSGCARDRLATKVERCRQQIWPKPHRKHQHANRIGYQLQHCADHNDRRRGRIWRRFGDRIEGHRPYPRSGLYHPI
jgi:hypothetical protein